MQWSNIHQTDQCLSCHETARETRNNFGEECRHPIGSTSKSLVGNQRRNYSLAGYCTIHEYFLSAWTHAAWTVIRTRRYGTNVVFVFFLGEEMRKITFCQFVQTKGFGKIDKWHRYEIQRVDEFNERLT